MQFVNTNLPEERSKVLLTEEQLSSLPEELLSTYQRKLAEPDVLDIIDNNQQKFEPYAAMVDRAYENLNSEFVDNQDAHGKIENDEAGQPTYSEDTEPTEKNSQVHESNLAPGEFMPRIPTDEKIAASIRTFNKKQRMVFDVLHQ